MVDCAVKGFSLAADFLDLSSCNVRTLSDKMEGKHIQGVRCFRFGGKRRATFTSTQYERRQQAIR